MSSYDINLEHIQVEPIPGRPTVARDEAFWNTYEDIQREEVAVRAYGTAITHCYRSGHSLGSSGCRTCTAPQEAADAVLRVPPTGVVTTGWTER